MAQTGWRDSGYERFIEYVTLEDTGHDLQVTLQPQYKLQNICDLSLRGS